MIRVFFSRQNVLKLKNAVYTDLEEWIERMGRTSGEEV
jgi:hypothetical protein